MKKRNFLLVTLLAGSLLATGVSIARPDGCDGPHKGHGDHMMHELKQLNLSDKQLDAIRAIKKEQRKDMRSTFKQMKQIRKEMRAQAHSDQYDATKVRQLADAQAKIMADMMVEHVKTMHEIRKQLTPDQLKKFDSMQKDHERDHDRGHRFEHHDDEQDD